MNVSFLLIVPMLTAVVVGLAANARQVKLFALAGTILQLLLVAFLVMVFLQQPGYNQPGAILFEVSYAWFAPLHINFHAGVDGFSVAMIVLTSLVVLAGVLVSWKITLLPKEFFMLLLVLSAGAYGFFISLDLFVQFFFLELAVVPKFLLIAVWGSGKKEYSAMKLALMLMAGSALVFTGLTALYFAGAPGAQSFDLVHLGQYKIPVQTQLYCFPLLFTGFGVFTAIFPFHTWVPDGHSSAPTAASMFLAGISMKLGGYGCLRVAVYLMPVAARYYSPFIVVLATIAILYGSFATMMQQDLKYMNAYSSVSHCGFVLLGIGMLTRVSLDGAVLQMLSHGLMTALFFAAIGMIYDRTHTRMLGQLGGLLRVMPFISSVFVLAGLCSLGLPGLSGFVAEMTVFMGSWPRQGTLYRVSTILACASIVVTAVYILRAVAKTVFGPQDNPVYADLGDAGWYEKVAAGLMGAGILFIGLLPFWVLRFITPETTHIIQQAGNAIPLK